MAVLPEATLAEALRTTNLLESGRVLNTARAEEGLTTIHSSTGNPACRTTSAWCSLRSRPRPGHQRR